MRLTEITKIIFEDPIPQKDAADVWSENEADTASYITSVVYDVKPSDAKQGFYEVTYDDDGKRATYGVLNKDDLNASFTPLRSNQSPDAEGYVQYRSADVYEAFKYSGDPVKVDLGPQSDSDNSKAPGPEVVLMNKGDYLLRQTSGNNFTYSIEKANYFDNGYVKKV